MAHGGGFPLFGLCLEALVAAECCALISGSRQDSERRSRRDEEEHDKRIKAELRLEAEQRENARLREEQLRLPPVSQRYGTRLRL